MTLFSRTSPCVGGHATRVLKGRAATSAASLTLTHQGLRCAAGHVRACHRSTSGRDSGGLAVVAVAAFPSGGAGCLRVKCKSSDGRGLGGRAS